jgi:glycine oxidase
MIRDVMIMGGGVIGCAIAYYLRKAGVAVTLIERGQIGGQASSAAAGLLAPLGPLSGPGPFADLVLAGFRLFPQLVPELVAASNSGVDLGYAQTGALRTVRNPKRVAHLQKRMQAWQPLGLTMHWLTGEEARQREPGLAADICAAIYAPEESQIQAPKLTQAFAQAAGKLGAELLDGQEIIALVTDNATVKVVRTSRGEMISCSLLIIATGAWSARWSAWLNLPLPVSPLQGQMLALEAPSPPLRHIIFGEGAYVAPGALGVMAGATKEDLGFDPRVTEEGRAWLHDTACRLVPALADYAQVAAWAGLRPKTPDSQPLLGPVPGWKNVIVATGHNSVGIILSGITGQSIAELVVTGRVPALIAPFSVERFLT